MIKFLARGFSLALLLAVWLPVLAGVAVACGMFGAGVGALSLGVARAVLPSLGGSPAAPLFSIVGAAMFGVAGVGFIVREWCDIARQNCDPKPRRVDG